MRIFLLAGSKFIPSTFHLREHLGLNPCPLATQVTCSHWLLASGPLGFMVIQGQEDPVESSGLNDYSCFFFFSEELAKRIQEAEELAAQRQQQQADQPPAGGSRDRHRGPRGPGPGQGQGRRSPQRSEKSKNVSNLHHWPFL